MKLRIIILFITCFFTIIKVFSQLNYYEDSFNGGVTCAGYSPAYSSGGTGSFTVNIAAGSTIRKAFLMAGKHGNAAPLTGTLNTFSYTFDPSNQITNFISPIYGGASGVHIIDVTLNINPSINNYTLTIPNTSGPSDRFNDFYLFIAYENNTLPLVNTAIFINTVDIATSVTYNLSLINPVQSAIDIGLSLFTGYICDDVADGEIITVNSINIGTIGGSDINSDYCGGPIGSFYYEECTLNGLSDDNPDLAMTGADALSNINSIIPNNSNSFSIQFQHQTNSTSNAIWGVILAYGSSCDTCFVNAGNDLQICLGADTVLNAVGSGGTSPYNYSWSPASGLSATNISNPTASPTVTTTYTVTSTDFLGCISTDSVTVTVLTQFSANAGSDTSICIGDSVNLLAIGGNTYTWSPIGSLSDPNISNPVASPTVTTTYTVTVSSSGGCTATDSVIVQILPNLIVNIGNDTTICGDSTQTLDAGNNGATYLWSTGDTTQTIIVDSSGSYSVFVNIGSCSGNDTINIIFDSAPTISIGSDIVLCPDSSVVLDAGNIGANYLWSTGETSQSITASTQGTYWVMVTMGNCIGYDTISITKVQNINLGSDISLCHTTSVILDACSSSQLYWSTGETSCAILVEQPGEYWVISNYNNCNLSDTINITDGYSSIYVPNAFTPDNDGTNEFFSAKGEGITLFDMNIYNRWGELIFHSNNINIGWDGTYKGVLAELGVYMCVIDYRLKCKGERNLQIAKPILLVK